MKLLRHGATPEATANRPIFTGEVSMRPMIATDDGAQVGVSLVHFHDGARTKSHRHGADQVLYITAGHGAVGNSDGDNEVETGDIVHIPAGEAHWHGARPGRDMSHLSIMPPCETQVLE